MNNLTIDGTNLAAGEVPGANLEEILTTLMEHPVVANRVITKVLLNGDIYSEEMPHAALEVDRGQIDSLELETHTAEDLSLHFLENGHYFVGAMREALP
ncbi:MAG: hypothetical protein LBV79_06170, partial [Candidatus Adiutrix sp.]|nr:hypothetical protein [Candidatus Adiutrix sp.]